MPHAVVKPYAGRSEQQKAEPAARITQAVMASMQCTDAAVSVGIEDVRPADWAEKVYKPDIVGKPGTLFKRSRYNPL